MRDKGEDGDNVTRVRSTDRVRQQRGHHRGMGINEGLGLCVVYALYVIRYWQTGDVVSGLHVQ